MARVFVMPGESQGHLFHQRKRSEPEETDWLANTVGVLFEFGSSQASAAEQVAVIRVFLSLNVFSVSLSLFNYFVKCSSPWPERVDF